MLNNQSILFLTLRTFSAAGGIERLCRIISKALFEDAEVRSGKLRVYSMYDNNDQIDERYLPASLFKGFGVKKILFVYEAIKKGLRNNIVILSHKNLLPVGYIIKTFSPRTRLILFAHGIEVWKPAGKVTTKMMLKADAIICVSRFTRDQMIKVHHIQSHRLIVLNNCLDPFLPASATEKKNSDIKLQYQIKDGDIVLLTLSRLSAHDRDKGYEKVLIAIKELLPSFPNLKYLIGGKYESDEKVWLDGLIETLGIEKAVIFAGYIPEEDLAAIFQVSDVYIMPSTKEGFGIVFIEAMHYGLPVIAGNKDGSTDALADGQLGLLVNPDDQKEITGAVLKIITNKAAYTPEKQIINQKFDFEVYKQKLQEILNRLAA